MGGIIGVSHRTQLKILVVLEQVCYNDFALNLQHMKHFENSSNSFEYIVQV